MVGLMFFAALIAWLFLAIRLARWISKKSLVRPSLRPITVTALAAVIFLLPVADELAARPYFEVLCHRGAVLRVNEQGIRGSKVMVTAKLMNARVDGVVLPMFHSHFTYVNPSSGEVLAEYETYTAEGGALARLVGIAHSHPLTGSFYCAPEGLESASDRYGFAVIN